MGLMSRSELINAKFTTAIVIDRSNRAFFIPIKWILGDYFLATIEKQMYCFHLDGGRIFHTRNLLAKSFKFTIFFTDHYNALSPKDTKAIEELLLTNNLPKINKRLLDIFTLLGKREKNLKPDDVFEGHSLQELIDLVAIEQADYPEQAENLKHYLERLDAKTINTPVKAISEFIEDDLQTTDSKFLGDMLNQLKKTDQEQKKMSNTPISGKSPLIKIIVILVAVGAIAGLGIWAYSSGAFDHIGLPSQFGGSQPLTTSSIMTQYPTPEALKKAIDSGAVKYNDLPKEAKAMLDNYKPVAIPINQTK